MTALKIDGVKVFADTKFFPEKELTNYVEYATENVKPLTLTEISVKLVDDGKVDIEFETHDKFESIRRITGYLTGDLNSWNDAKRAEEKERVKHEMRGYP